MFCRSSRVENRCDPLDSGVVVITHVLWLHAAFPPVSLPADQRPARGLSCNRLRAHRRALNRLIIRTIDRARRPEARWSLTRVNQGNRVEGRHVVCELSQGSAKADRPT
jgi:hypothetical protein